MVRTQVLLPDDLYARVKRVAQEKELSMTEVARRALESWLERFPMQPDREWKLPVIDGGGIRVPLENLRDTLAEVETRQHELNDFD